MRRLLTLLPLFLARPMLAAQMAEVAFHKNGPRVIVPSLGPADNGAEYVRLVKGNSKLEKIDGFAGFVSAQPTGKPFIGPVSSVERPRMLLLANDFSDLTTADHQHRVWLVADSLTKAGADVYVLAPLHDIGLNARQARDFRDKIIRHFSGVVALGGDDVDPSLYKQENNFAKSTNLDRDVSEIKFIKQYLRRGEGTFFGICRGHQICSVSQGWELVQDIVKQTSAGVNHRGTNKNEVWHWVKLEKDSLLAQILGKDRVYVNTYHHQAVSNVIAKDSPLRIAAVAEDPQAPLVEAIEFKDQLGFTVQWHPEYMFNDEGEKILSGMVELTRQHLRSFAQFGRPCRTIRIETQDAFPLKKAQ